MNRTQELIDKFDITYNSRTNQIMAKIKNATKDEIAEIKANKNEIINQIKENERLAKERFKRNVPGLDILRDAYATHERNRNKFHKMMDTGSSVYKPEKEQDFEELKKKYPIAAAYMLADEWSFSNNVDKRSAGRRAKEEIASGQDWKKAIDDMKKRWDDYCDQHIWD